MPTPLRRPCLRGPPPNLRHQPPLHRPPLPRSSRRRPSPPPRQDPVFPKLRRHLSQSPVRRPRRICALLADHRRICATSRLSTVLPCPDPVAGVFLLLPTSSTTPAALHGIILAAAIFFYHQPPGTSRFQKPSRLQQLQWHKLVPPDSRSPPGSSSSSGSVAQTGESVNDL